MAEFISDYFGKDFDAVGVFDAVMDSDSHYFINVTRLKDTTTPEFLESYSKINSYFHEIALLLSFANEKTHKTVFTKRPSKSFLFQK